MAKGSKGKSTPAPRGVALKVYVTPETMRELNRRAGQEREARGEHVSVSGLVGEWIERELSRKGGR